METALAIWQGLLINLGPLVVLALGTLAVQWLHKRGYQATYLAALVRAVGQGQIACNERGISLFSPAGRLEAVRAGTDYLLKTVGPEAAALGLGEQDHASRIVGQIGSIEAAAQAALLPAIGRVPGDTITPSVGAVPLTRPTPIS